MVLEWVIAFSVSANVFLGLGLAGVTYLLWRRIPTLDQLEDVGMAVVDAQLEKRGFGDVVSEGGGGRAGEGLVDKVLRIPGVGNAIGQLAQNFMNKQTGMGQYGQ